ncbi:hypothetical protein ROZALSC1DRAFT_26480 [Rozella allomycis CSF55]|uniref:B box-type domain-containing protein n=1 Tax=Rozella allomycis (strain CSF55) TaxID=988480 RepID=A0A075B064_ROZAC|nr:hypothetical protein O9G_000536 [Rozella allomycis CSF55]RKP22142.1 hypothetical protein ROZALSC1DRAFT_26480 [Rozella allomycis CSF55]|eukprot:EPZ34349.1 hypothetical protein O9G_000536 [Rozella allomycis CSF55]
MSTDKTQLTTASSSFSFLEYFLQISIKGTTARIVNAYALSNPHLTVSFENKCQDMLVLDSWVDMESLSSPNTEEEIIKNGFQFTNGGGHKFAVGSLRPLYKNDIMTGKKIVKKVLLAKIGVGRSYFADEEYAKIGTLPDGYDSFYNGKIVDKLQEAPPQKGDDIDQDYYQEYILKDSTQVLPLYIITFEFDPNLEKKSRDKNYCDNCEKSVASVYCTADSAYLCHACDVTLHNSKLTSRHTRTPIGQGPEVFGNCRHHADKAVEFFCPQCHVPVCVHCKMVGHHSSGESAKHKLVSVQEAYKSVYENSLAPDPILHARKSSIENQLNCIAARAKLVEKNSAEIKQQIDDLYKKALAELKIVTKKKLTVLKGDECELYRQLFEIHRLEEFLKYQQSGGDPTQFLLNWGRHLQIRSELHAFRFFRDVIDVQADIKCGGNIIIQMENNQTNVNQNRPGSAASVSGSSFTLQSKKGNVYDAIATGKPRLPASKPLTGKSVTKNDGSSILDDRSKVRRTSDFFAETLHALDLNQDDRELSDITSIQDTEA